MDAELLDVIEHYRPRLDGAPVYVRPDIPAGQLAAAIATYGAGVLPEEVLLFVDSSPRRDGTTGCLVTRTTFRAHEPGATTALPLAEIHDVALAGHQVRVNGRFAVANVFLVGVGAFTDLLLDLGHVARTGAPLIARDGGLWRPHLT